MEGLCQHPPPVHYNAWWTHRPIPHNPPLSLSLAPRVKEYDSYKFESKNWRLLEHYFCKIDTWLEGICEPSGQVEWSWLSKNPNASRPTSAAIRRSIFSQASVEEAADGDDE